MAQDLPRVSANVVLPKPSLQKVFDNLRASGFSLVGPVVRDGAVVLEEISGMEDLPLGWTAEQGPGRYRLKRREDLTKPKPLRRPGPDASLAKRPNTNQSRCGAFPPSIL